MTDLALVLEEGLWDTLKHPRGRGGKWIDVVGGEVAQAAEKAGDRVSRPSPSLMRKDVPLERTQAFARGRRRLRYMRETSVHGDEFMYDLAVDRGFAGQPKKVSEAELEQAIADGDTEMWRGMTDRDYASLLVDGTYYAGAGFRGSGTYVATGPDGKKKATSYALAPPSRGIASKSETPTVVRMALAKDARVADYSVIAAEAKAKHLEQKGVKADPGSGAGMGGSSAQVLAEVARDPMRWAMAQGFDAVKISDGEWVVLNRTALLVSKAFVPAGENVFRRAA